MAFIEHNQQIYLNDPETTKDNIQTLFVDNLGLTADDNNDLMFWCDNNKNLGFLLYESGSTTYSIKIINTVSNYVDILFINNTFKNIMWQKSIDGDIKYFRNPYPSNNMFKCLIAKSDNNEWFIINNGYMYHKDGLVPIGTSNIVPDANVPFSAVRVPNVVSGGNFPNLYKFNTATIFSVAGTYVAFDGKPYRAVCTDNTTESNAKIGYAYPVADEE